MIQADKEDQEMEESENDNDNEEIPLISIKKAADGLKTFISFFEQQNELKQLSYLSLPAHPPCGASSLYLELDARMKTLGRFANTAAV